MLLPVTRSSSINLDEESKKKSAFVGHASSYKSSVAVGLRILIQLSRGESNVVVKSTLKMSKPTFQMNRIPAANYSLESCFLKSCYLCNKNLSPDKDVYMYRGDQGFCSIECRSRQIELDEMREIESCSSKKRVASSFRHCHTTSTSGSGRRETRLLLEEFLHRHKPLSSPKDRPILLL